MNVVVVGGGIMGLAVALELADRGAKVTVLERGALGGEASGAAAGILGAQLEGHGPGPLLDVLVRARAAYGPWARSLEERTGLATGFLRSGVLRVALTDDELRDARFAVEMQRRHGLTAEMVDGAEARAIEPHLSHAVHGAAYFPDDGQVEPKRLLVALVAAARAAGVSLREGADVQRLVVEGGRCVGAAVAGVFSAADATVLAAGSWSSLLAGVPADLPPVRPIRGQMVELFERPTRLRTILCYGPSYVVPRGDGRVACGSTMEAVGYARAVTAGGLASILAGTMAMAPELEHAEVKGMWCGFRPECAAPLPRMGRSALPGLFLATGHHRNGVLLAHYTAQRVASELTSPPANLASS